MSYRDIFNGYELCQLRDIRDILSEIIRDKEEEEKKIVWRVCNHYICVGNFRQEEYLKAVDCLAEQARKAYNQDNHDDGDLRLEIERHRVPISEYEKWFE